MNNLAEEASGVMREEEEVDDNEEELVEVDIEDDSPVRIEGNVGTFILIN